MAAATRSWSSQFAVVEAFSGTEHPLPQRNRPQVQVVVAQRGRAQYLRVDDQASVLVGQFGETRRSAALNSASARLGAFVIALRRGQAGVQELGPARIAADHVRDVGVRHRHLAGRFRHGAGRNPGVDRQTVADAPDAFVHSVIRASSEVDLAQLGEDFQHQVVSIFPLDRGHQGQQEVPGAGLVGDQCQAAGPL